MSVVTTQTTRPLTMETTPLMRETPSLLSRICSCACRIIPRKENEYQNSSYESNYSSFLQRLREFNAYSSFPYEIDDNARALWYAELLHVPQLPPLRWQCCNTQAYKIQSHHKNYVDTSDTGG